MESILDAGCIMEANDVANAVQPFQVVGHDDEDVLTIAEVATDLRCSKAHVYNLINGVVLGVPPLRAMSMGRRKVVRWGVLKKWKRDLEQDGHGNDMLRESPEVVRRGTRVKGNSCAEDGIRSQESKT